MIKALVATEVKCYHIKDGKQIPGTHENISGDTSKLVGDTTGLSGDVSGLSGDVTNIIGNATGIKGDIAACALSGAERSKTIPLVSLVADKAI